MTSPDKFSEILKQIRENTCGSTLNLDSNRKDEGAKELAEALEKNNTLTTVNLSNNGIGDEGAIALSTALVTNTTLKELNLKHNYIEDEGAKALSTALVTNTSLKELNLKHNYIKCKGAIALAEALQTNTSLTTLDLTNNKIGDAGAMGLANMLRHNKTLTHLDLYHNDIGDVGAKALAKALKTNKTLTTLNLSSNRIEDEGAKALEGALGTNTTLIRLELNRNLISAREAQASGQAEELRTNKLKIDMNIISTLSDFESLVEKEKKFVMFITVNSTKYEYECEFRPFRENVLFLSENGIPFLILSFDGYGDIQITGLKFKTIETLTSLDTIFYLRTFFYRMIQIDTFYIIDVASVSCGDKDKIKYKALLYRLFATDKPLCELSIYYKYFTKITLNNKKGLDLQTLLTKYRSVYASFPKDFMDKPDCPEKAELLNNLRNKLLKLEEFNDFYNALKFFSVKTKDSIYYPCCEECDGLFCVNKREKSRQFLFKHTSSHRKQSTRRATKPPRRKSSKHSPVRVKMFVKSFVRRKSAKRSPARVKRV